VSTRKKRIRKQVDELTAEDFDMHPCWEYASDEEDVEDQDECTVRPLPLDALPDATRQVMVQAVFFFPNGRVRLGMVTLNAGDDPSGHQPILFGPKGLLAFYAGALPLRPSDLRKFGSVLRKIDAEPWPIRYVSSLCASDGTPLAFGVLAGLYQLEDWRTGTLRVVAA
jgi:hypothetical protein